MLPDLRNPCCILLEVAIGPPEIEKLRAGEFDSGITLYKLEIFCRVVEAGGITRGAEQIFLTQPVVTTHIRTLEERLGVALFDRRGRRNVLTEAGERTYLWGRKILDCARQLGRELEEIENGVRGAVSIAATMSAGSYLLPQLVARFAKERPNVRVRVTVSDRAATEEAVHLGEADFAMAIGELARPSKWLEFEVIGEEELVVVVPPDFDGEGPLSLEEVERLDFIEGPLSGRRELVERRLRDLGVRKMRLAMEVGHPEGIKRAVELGMGPAILFRNSIRGNVKRGTMREVTVAGADFTVPIIFTAQRNREFSHAQTDLIAVIRTACSANQSVPRDITATG